VRIGNAYIIIPCPFILQHFSIFSRVFPKKRPTFAQKRLRDQPSIGARSWLIASKPPDKPDGSLMMLYSIA
jgi:hypothetical protein